MSSEKKNTVRRRPGWSAIPNAVLADTSLSIQARGMLALIMSHADGWEFYAMDLRKKAGTMFKPLGRDRYRSIMRELSDVGYVKIILQHDPISGQITGRDWIINDEPQKDVDTSDGVDPDLFSQGDDTMGLKTRPEATMGLKNRRSENPTGGETRPYKNNKDINKNNHNNGGGGFDDIFDQFWDALKNKRDKSNVRQIWDEVMLDHDGRFAVNWEMVIWCAAKHTEDQGDTPIRYHCSAKNYLLNARWADHEMDYHRMLRDKREVEEKRRAMDEKWVQGLRDGKDFNIRQTSPQKAAQLIEQGLLTEDEARALKIIS